MAKLADVLGIDADLAIAWIHRRRSSCSGERSTARAPVDHLRSAWRRADHARGRPAAGLLLDGAWYCLAADHASGELRRFRLDRVQDAAPNGETFAPTGTATADLDAPFDAPAQAVAVRVWLPEDARWVAEYVPLTEVVDAVAAPAQAPPGCGPGYTATVTTVGTSFLARLLVRARGQVIDPPDWRDLTRQAATDILAGYDDPA
jgi:predicted DNA-binding transcriptional regulator YafY